MFKKYNTSYQRAEYDYGGQFCGRMRTAKKTKGGIN